MGIRNLSKAISLLAALVLSACTVGRSGATKIGTIDLSALELLGVGGNDSGGDTSNDDMEGPGDDGSDGLVDGGADGSGPGGVTGQDLSITITGPEFSVTQQSEHAFVVTATGSNVTGYSFNQISGPNQASIGSAISIGGGEFAIPVSNLILGVYRFQASISAGSETAFSNEVSLQYNQNYSGGADGVTEEWCDNPDEYFSADMIVYPKDASDEMTNSGWVTNSSGTMLYGSPSSPAINPHVWAIKKAGTGSYGKHVFIKAANWHNFWFKKGSSSSWHVPKINGTPESPVVVRGEPGTRILQWNDIFTIKFEGGGNHELNNIRFIDIQIEGSTWAAVFIGGFNNVSSQTPFSNIMFCRCEIDGMFNHQTQQMQPGKSGTKWGVFTWAADNLVWLRGHIHDIKVEHGFYVHNSLGPLTVKNAIIERVGRTAVQVTARLCEDDYFEDYNNNNIKDPGEPCIDLPPNPGDITIAGNIIRDTGIQSGDWHAGKAITITGRNNGVNIVHQNTIEFGFDIPLKNAILGYASDGKPYGTGAFVSWTTGSENYQPSNILYFTENMIRYAADSGPVYAASINSMNEAYVYGNHIEMGANNKAIILGEGGAQHKKPDIYCVTADNTLVDGIFQSLGQAYNLPFSNTSNCPSVPLN